MTATTLPFTDRVRLVLQRAERLAVQWRHMAIKPEHVFLALLLVPDAQAVAAMRVLGVDLDAVRQAVEATVPPGIGSGAALREAEGRRVAPALTTRAILREAELEAQQRGLTVIDTRMTLLGILRTPALALNDLLQTFGLTFETANEAFSILPVAPERVVSGPLLDLSPRVPLRLSPVFAGLISVTALAGLVSYTQTGFVARLALFFFVTGGWVICLSLHEFGHALVAFICGDRSVVHKGYLTLNPLKYTHPLLSIVLPLVFLAMGGIGLPGGAVYIDRSAIRRPWMMSLVSAAGPFATFICALAIATPFVFRLYDLDGHYTFWAGLALLGFLQLWALFINLLPIPGLDGFGIIEPFLPDAIRQLAFSIGQFSLFLLFFLLTRPNPVLSALQVALGLSAFLLNFAPAGTNLPFDGFDLFRFWVTVGR